MQSFNELLYHPHQQINARLNSRRKLAGEKRKQKERKIVRTIERTREIDREKKKRTRQDRKKKKKKIIIREKKIKRQLLKGGIKKILKIQEAYSIPSSPRLGQSFHFIHCPPCGTKFVIVTPGRHTAQLIIFFSKYLYSIDTKV